MWKQSLSATSSWSAPSSQELLKRIVLPIVNHSPSVCRQPAPSRCEVVLYLFSALYTSIIRAGFMLWKKKEERAGSCFLECIFQCYTYLGPRLHPLPQANIWLLGMCWDHLVSFSRCSCWCLWSCVFFHHNFLMARCPHLARRKTAWLLVKKKRKRTLPHTLESAVDVWILVLDKKGAFWKSDWCDCVCARTCVLHARVKGSREKGLACVSCIPAGLCIAQDFFFFLRLLLCGYP